MSDHMRLDSRPFLVITPSEAKGTQPSCSSLASRMRKFCTDLPGYSSENFPAADNGCFFQPPDIPDFSKSLVDDKFFESLEIEGNLHFPASVSSQPNKIGDCQAKKFCTDLPGYSPEKFPAADNETFFQLPDILDSGESLIDAKLFEKLEMDGDLHFPASGSGQPTFLYGPTFFHS